jgi:hypothetical protein
VRGKYQTTTNQPENSPTHQMGGMFFDFDFGIQWPGCKVLNVRTPSGGKNPSKGVPIFNRST